MKFCQNQNPTLLFCFKCYFQHLGELGILLYQPETNSKVETLDFELKDGDDLGPWSFKDLQIVEVEEDEVGEETSSTSEGMIVTPPSTDEVPSNESLSIRYLPP